jgi:hypothetical protein
MYVFYFQRRQSASKSKTAGRTVQMFVLNAHALWLIEFEPLCLCCSERQSMPTLLGGGLQHYKRPGRPITMQGRSARQSNTLFRLQAIFRSVRTQIRTQIRTSSDTKCKYVQGEPIQYFNLRQMPLGQKKCQTVVPGTYCRTSVRLWSALETVTFPWQHKSGCTWNRLAHT